MFDFLKKSVSTFWDYRTSLFRMNKLAFLEGCFYWTSFSLGLFTAPCCCCPPSISVQWPEGRREGGQKLGAGDTSSALPIFIELAQGLPGQCPTNPRPWGQLFTTSPQLAKCPTCAHCPATNCPALRAMRGSSWVPEPPRSAADTFEPLPIRMSLQMFILSWGSVSPAWSWVSPACWPDPTGLPACPGDGCRPGQLGSPVKPTSF